MKPQRLLPCSQESTTPRPVFLRTFLILSSHLLLGLPSGLFPPDSSYLFLSLASSRKVCLENVTVTQAVSKCLLLRYLKVHCCVYKSTPLDPTEPVQFIPHFHFLFLDDLFNIILPLIAVIIAFPFTTIDLVICSAFNMPHAFFLRLRLACLHPFHIPLPLSLAHKNSRT